MRESGQRYLLTISFLLIIGAVAPFQAVHELREGESPQVLDVFHHAPTAANLRAFEKDMENQSVLIREVRPPTQYARYRLMGDTGEQALQGLEGWWFYQPDVKYLTQRIANEPALQLGRTAAVSAIVGFRDALAQRGIRLLVLPVPGKPSIYPDRITSAAAPCDPRCHEHTEALLNDLATAGVETLDLFDVFRNERLAYEPGGAGELYLIRDTHWTNSGARCAAQAVAAKVRQMDCVSPGTVGYDFREVTVQRAGDVLHMLKCPPIEALFKSEAVICQQVVRRDDQKPYRDDPSSPILILGDSFLRIYERDEPGSAGLIAHLARELSRPLASIVSDGGASTLVRQDLKRKQSLLEGKTLVIWEFVERDVQFGMEGWQTVELGAPFKKPGSP